jgi:hypothetical protein
MTMGAWPAVFKKSAVRRTVSADVHGAGTTSAAGMT